MPRKILRTGAGFTLLSIFASALNFLFYPVVARTLNYSQYGEVQVGIAFIMQAAALFTTLNILALFFAAQKEDQRHLTVRLERFVVFISIFLAVLVFVLANPIAHSLKLADPKILYLLSVIFIINIPCATWLGSLQGNGQFMTSGVISVISSISKIVVGLTAIKLGMGAYGALVGILVGTSVILPLAYTLQNKKVITFSGTFARFRKRDLLLFKDNPRLGLIFLTLFVLAITSTLDVIFSKANFSPSSAGLYAQLSTAAKIPYFASLPLAIILFERFIKNPAKTTKPLFLFGAYVAAAALAAIVLQKLIIGNFFGTTQYDHSTMIYLIMGFSFYSLGTVLIYSLLSKQWVKRAAAVSLSSLVITTLLLLLGADSLIHLARAYSASQFLTVLLAIGLQYTKIYAEK